MQSTVLVRLIISAGHVDALRDTDMMEGEQEEHSSASSRAGHAAALHVDSSKASRVEVDLHGTQRYRTASGLKVVKHAQAAEREYGLWCVLPADAEIEDSGLTPEEVTCLTATGITVNSALTMLGFVCVEGSEEGLVNFLHNTCVDAEKIETLTIESDFDIETAGEVESGALGGSHDGDGKCVDPWGLRQIGALGNARRGGRGVHVYVMDTGIRTSHEEFNGRAKPLMQVQDGIATSCAGLKDEECGDDVHGHGTHVAATLGGEKCGVAAKSTLHAVKVMNDQGVGSFTSFVAGLDAVLASRMEPKVVCASVSGKVVSHGVEVAITEATLAGVAIVVAAGNQGEDACHFTPAFVPMAITVGASDEADQIAQFSNGGSCVDLYAPGTYIPSAGLLDDAYVLQHGTSMAAPHVAGTIALLLDRDHRSTPEEDVQFLADQAQRTSHNFMRLHLGDLAKSEESLVVQVAVRIVRWFLR